MEEIDLELMSDNAWNFRFAFPKQWGDILEHQDILLAGIYVSSPITKWKKFRFLCQNVDIELYDQTHNFWGGECENVLDKFQSPVILAKIDILENDSDCVYFVADDDDNLSPLSDTTITIRWMSVPAVPLMFFYLEGNRTCSYTPNSVFVNVVVTRRDIIESNVYLQVDKQGESVPAEHIKVAFDDHDDYKPFNGFFHEIHIATPTMLCLVQPNGNFYVAASGDDICENVSCTIIKVSGHIVEL